jgi:hypothetical protein
MNEPVSGEKRDERPPVFSTWRAVYAFVLGFLALVIGALYLFGRAFS